MAAHRILFVIDISPLTHLQNPSNYISAILNSTKSLLFSPSLSKSLSSYYLFFSTISSSLSPNLSQSISFKEHGDTLFDLYRELEGVVVYSGRVDGSGSGSKGSFVAGTLFRIVRECKWGYPVGDLGKSGNSINIRSNLVLLFSPIGKVGNWVSDFVNDDEEDAEIGTVIGNVETFRRKFCDIFRGVNEAYVRRDVHCSWVDVEFDEEKNESLAQLELFKCGVRSLGWGFCSTDSIVLGLRLIPFELIYPLFGYPSNYLGLIGNCKPIHTQLSLEISDVGGGEPLECNYCDIDLFCLEEADTTTVSDVIKTLRFKELVIAAQGREKRILSRFGGGIAKIHLKSVIKSTESAIENFSSDMIFVRCDYTKETRKSVGERASNFFANRVLEAVSSDTREFNCSKNGPTWQILLSFLSRNGYDALVTIISEQGDSFMAILKPFTVHLATISIVIDKHTTETEYNLLKLINIDGKLTESESLPSTNNLSSADQNRIKQRNNLYKHLTWTKFRKAAIEFTAMELEEAYFYGKFSISKKLRFLKCWMKEVNKISNSSLTVKDNNESCKQIKIDTSARLLGTEDDSQLANSSCSLTEPSRVQDLVVYVGSSETSESFFNNLPKKIKDGLKSEGANLQNLAERLVNLSIYWLSQKNDTCYIMENEAPNVMAEDPNRNMVADLVKVLLKDPKELKDRAKNNSSLFAPSDPNYVGSPSENIVKEHELQIFFRLEILRSKFATSIEASTKRKLVKQICDLLVIIQFLVEGDFHGNVTLYDYVEKSIKTRYFHVLEDVINKIYVRMDLLPIDYADVSPTFQFNSDDSNHSRRDIGRNEFSENHDSCSGENNSSKTEIEFLQEDISKDESLRQLSGVQERKDKASRYLQRVWAPKQANGVTLKSEPMRKQCKRKERSKKKGDVVCETPSFDKKFEAGDRLASVSKALFQDNQ